ncbi:DUF6339 family protein [Mammaliicoccus sciuri]|uniref:DUF6339 family protein n=1 Tax=Mammaliicoccus sciuri TaxID=1296 RepID=UPI001331037F|nr:DUF6339 family protein [Mammaliicoccus sciuri]MEB6254131.1 DUF6339 family protein [Mammaliicoccus sciuri]MEB6256946.1 DUF6339 family protein [Mammaliicoccus sciuri]MEB6294563.1 DUF6339 family protein [Mammaliicoccus sciuri]MEB8191511.1 DUF6339 family protein [Mammaliicoccus sciuri]WQK71774.1 DUF6339 family protein [Mammaliicoccus sciuri]
MKHIKYVTDVFLDEFKSNFDSKYLDLYKRKNKSELENLFNSNGNILESSKEFNYKPLILDPQNANDSFINVKTLWESLGNLTVVEAENQKVWVALENTYYIDYHLKQLEYARNDKAIKSRTIFTESNKRSLIMNNLSLLWWIAYYTHDSSHDDPYYYTKFFLENSYRGNAIAFFSSNIISNKEISIGILSALKELTETNKIKINRYAYTNSNKILNQIAGVRIIDTLTRYEIKNIILDNLLDTDKLQTP